MPQFDIFISFKKSENGIKTQDFYLAKKLYESLKQQGFQKIFFSEEEISNQGNSNFPETINHALETSTTLIFVCTKAAYLHSSFVKYEWESFLNEINSGRKKGQIIGFISGINVSDLPYGLRKWEMFDQQQGIDELVRFLRVIHQKEAQNELIDYKSILKNQTLKKINENRNLKEKYLFRDDAYGFVNAFLAQEYPLAVIEADDISGKDGLILICAENSFLNQDFIVYCKKIQEIETSISIIPTNLREQIKIVVFLEQISIEEDLIVLSNLFKTYKKIRILTTVSLEKNDFINLLKVQYSPVWYHLPVLKQTELHRVIYQLASELNLSLTGNLEILLLNPESQSFQNPFMIRLILKGMKRLKQFANSDLNMVDLFGLVDAYLETNQMSSLQTIDFLASVYAKKKIHSFHETEIKDLKNDITFLKDLSILKRVRSNYEFSSKSYLEYKTALWLLTTQGITVNKEIFIRLENVYSFYVYLRFIQTGHLATEFKDILSENHCKKMLSLFFSEPESFIQIIHDRFFHSSLIELIKDYRRLGLNAVAYDIIELIEKANLPQSDSFDYLSEKVILHYYLFGKLLPIQEESILISHRKGYIYYLLDEYSSSRLEFEKAFKRNQSLGGIDPYLVFDYVDLEYDSGNFSKVNELLDSLNRDDLKKDGNLQTQFYLIKAMVALESLDFEYSETCIKQAIELCYQHFNLRRLQRSLGEAGFLYLVQGQYEKAKGYFGRNLEIAQSIEDYQGMGIASKLLGFIEMMMLQPQSAIKYFTYAEKYLEKVGNYWRLLKTRLYIMWFKHFDEKELNQIIDDSSIVSSDIFQSQFQSLVSLTYFIFDQKEKAKEYAEKANILATKTNSPISKILSEGIQHYVFHQPQSKNNPLSAYLGSLFNVVEEAKKGTLKVYEKLLLPLDIYRELETTRISLIHLSVRHAHDIFDYASNPICTRFVLWDQHQHIMDTIKYIQTISKHDLSGSYFSWGIYHKKDKKIIGTIDLVASKNTPSIELGYILHHDYWKKGLATEALIEVIRFARHCLKVSEMMGYVIEGNEASVKTLVKQGFAYRNLIQNYNTKHQDKSSNGLLFSLKI
jgi:ribosomal-protein-alanine N-acetyltransferase